MLLSHELGQVAGPHPPCQRRPRRLRGQELGLHIFFEVLEAQRGYFGRAYTGM
jgi:hypothetical protein